jgi:hypothetical protein
VKVGFLQKHLPWPVVELLLAATDLPAQNLTGFTGLMAAIHHRLH